VLAFEGFSRGEFRKTRSVLYRLAIPRSVTRFLINHEDYFEVLIRDTEETVSGKMRQWCPRGNHGAFYLIVATMAMDTRYRPAEVVVSHGGQHAKAASVETPLVAVLSVVAQACGLSPLASTANFGSGSVGVKLEVSVGDQQLCISGTSNIASRTEADYMAALNEKKKKEVNPPLFLLLFPGFDQSEEGLVG
jgi:hypothetical protein